MHNRLTEIEARRHNTGLAKVAVQFSADSLVVAESFVLRIKFSGKSPAHRKPAKRWWQLFRDNPTYEN